MAEITYLNSEEHHNKFWSYEITGNSVTVRWGRVGFDGIRSQTKVFDSPSKLEKFVSSKVAEKLDKGYKEATRKTLQDEVQTAKELGVQNKIVKTLWVHRNGETLTLLDKYDPAQFVLVEILNSWTKSAKRLLLSKSETLEVVGGYTTYDRKLSVNHLSPLPHHDTFATAVRSRLKRLAETLVEVLKKVEFASLGRNLFGDDESTANDGGVSAYQAAMAQVDTTGIDSSVITTFASMGRALEL